MTCCLGRERWIVEAVVKEVLRIQGKGRSEELKVKICSGYSSGKTKSELVLHSINNKEEFP